MGRYRNWIFLGAGFLAVLALVVVLLVACRPSPGPGQPTGQVEVEDCDAEDRAKGEWWECGYIAPTNKPMVTKPKPVTPPKNPPPIRRNK